MTRAYFDSAEHELVRIATYTGRSAIGGSLLVAVAIIATAEGQPWLAAPSGLVGFFGLACASDGYEDRKAVLDRYASLERSLITRTSDRGSES
jgi:ligand-binding sensor domain-containing protein